MTEAFKRKYTAEQREAVAIAYEDRRIHPYRRVVDLAAAGDLEHNGVKLEPFTIPKSTVSSEVARLRRRRAGEVTSQLSGLPPRDGIEVVRQRLLNSADAMLQVEERKTPEQRNPGRLREIARMMREVAAIPGPGEPRPPAPGQKVNGQRDGGETRGGEGSRILTAHRATAEGSGAAHERPAPDAPLSETTRDNATERSPLDRSATNGHNDDSPGSLAREHAAAVLDGALGVTRG